MLKNVRREGGAVFVVRFKVGTVTISGMWSRLGTVYFTLLYLTGRGCAVMSLRYDWPLKRGTSVGLAVGYPANSVEC